jgi:hypothetical protein
MRGGKSYLGLVLVLQVLLFASPSDAMTMEHYGVNSLVYMSTDIVIANISQDAQHKFTATVTEPLYGSLQANDRIEGLTPFLGFFQPMEDGMKAVLFLDRRPRHYDFFNAEAAKAPFAVPPSGVYLIDAYGHVHEYFQSNNPGPYVAQGYEYFIERSVPTKEQDLALPSLDAVKDRIAMAIKTVDPIRPLLGKTATRADVPALMHLVDQTSEDDKDCGLRIEVVTTRAMQQILSLNDPELALKAHAIAGGFGIEGFADASRVPYLVDTLSQRKKDATLRNASVEILLNLSKFHNGPGTGPFGTLPFDNVWVKGSAAEIQATSKAIFDDASENTRLRGLCVQFLSLDDPEVLADVRRVYAQTHSEELRFAIEDAFLRVSDTLYQSLNPPGGPVASRISPARGGACARMTHADAAFLLQYRQRNDFHQQSGFARPRYTLTNLKTGEHFNLEHIHCVWGWSSVSNGQSEFELGTLPYLPAGGYSLAFQYSLEGKIVTTGYGLKLSIRRTSRRNEISVNKVTSK